MSYLNFLQWIIANAGKFRKALELLQQLAELFRPEAESGTLGITESVSIAPATAATAETETLEAQALTALAGAYGDSEAQAVFDGSRLRKLWEMIGPLLPVLIKLFGG